MSRALSYGRKCFLANASSCGVYLCSTLATRYPSRYAMRAVSAIENAARPTMKTSITTTSPPDTQRKHLSMVETQNKRVDRWCSQRERERAARVRPRIFSERTCDRFLLIRQGHGRKGVFAQN